jgi:hypothetical protein
MVLFFTEMWERFGFYIMMAIFYLYMDKSLGWNDERKFSTAYSWVGLFNSILEVSGARLQPAPTRSAGRSNDFGYVAWPPRLDRPVPGACSWLPWGPAVPRHLFFRRQPAGKAQIQGCGVQHSTWGVNPGPLAARRHVHQPSVQSYNLFSRRASGSHCDLPGREKRAGPGSRRHLHGSVIVHQETRPLPVRRPQRIPADYPLLAPSSGGTSIRIAHRWPFCRTLDQSTWLKANVPVFNPFFILLLTPLLVAFGQMQKELGAVERLETSF